MNLVKPMTAAILISLSMTAAFAQDSTQTTDVVATTESVATPTVTEQPTPITQAQQVPAPVSTLPKEVTDKIGSPEAGKALVVFFRPKNFVGAAVGFKVRENEVELGKLRNGNYFAIQATPGAHEYVVHSEAKDITKIEVEEGETYFLKGEITMGFMAGRPNLSPSTAINFQSDLSKLKPSKPLK
jgi:Protein of unknown function (DUF2846)